MKVIEYTFIIGIQLDIRGLLHDFHEFPFMISGLIVCNGNLILY